MQRFSLSDVVLCAAHVRVVNCDTVSSTTGSINESGNFLKQVSGGDRYI
jgi:hypothetical protein